MELMTKTQYLPSQIDLIIHYINTYWFPKPFNYMRFTYHHIRGVQFHDNPNSFRESMLYGSEVLTGCDIIKNYKHCKTINKLIEHLDKVIVT
jgi:hypothetical protein